MQTLTFLHTSDLHLGAPFRDLVQFPVRWQAYIQQSIPNAFTKMVDTALAHRVDFVVIAGDIFDNTYPTYADFRLFIRGMEQLNRAQIPVYYVTGNHDPLNSWKNTYAKLPDNMHLLADGVVFPGEVGRGETDGVHASRGNAPGFAVFEKDGVPLVILGGNNYQTKNYPEKDCIARGLSGTEMRQAVDAICRQQYDVSADQVPLTVGVIHSGLSIDPTRSPIAPSKLVAKNCNYWACGHIHQPMFWDQNGQLIRVNLLEGGKGYQQIPNVEVAFSGSPQGRSRRETGPHGALLVSFDLANVATNTISFVPLADLVWENITLDVGGCQTILEIQQQIDQALWQHYQRINAQKLIANVLLVGQTVLYEELTAEVFSQIRQEINEGQNAYLLNALNSNLSPCINEDSLLAQGLFPAVFMDVADTLIANPQEIKRLIEAEFTDAGMPMPNMSDAHVLELAQQARQQILAKLMGAGK